MQDQLRRLMQKAGLAKYTDEILKLAWNSIRIRTKPGGDAELPLGASKIGGQPDLPEGCEWPKYLHDIRFMLELDGIIANRAVVEEGVEATPDTSKSDEEILSEFEAFINDFNEKRNAEWHANPVPQPPEPAGGPVMATTPLSFLAQFRMADLAPYDTEGLLPRTGLLYFFYDAICQPGGCGPSDPNGHRVMYHDGDVQQLRRTPFPDDLRDYGRFPSRAVSFSQEPTLPGYESAHLRLIGLTGDDEFTYCETVFEPCTRRRDDDSEKNADTSVHRMLGHPDPDQTDVFMDSERGRNPKAGYDDPKTWKEAGDWRLLLQLASINDEDMRPEMMWGDLGHLYFCIKKDDLAARDFSKVWLEHQCG